MVVPKNKNSSPRICVAFTEFNNRIVRERVIMQSVEKSLAKLVDAHFFRKTRRERWVFARFPSTGFEVTYSLHHSDGTLHVLYLKLQQGRNAFNERCYEFWASSLGKYVNWMTCSFLRKKKSPA